MPITIGSPRGEAGVDSLYNTEEKIFEDIRANPGEKAFIFIHSVPFEGSVSLVNLLTSTRLVRKGFDVSIILYGPGVLLASRHRGYPTIGTEGFPGQPGREPADRDAAQGGRDGLRLPVRHGRPVRLPRGGPHRRRQGLQPA